MRRMILPLLVVAMTAPSAVGAPPAHAAAPAVVLEPVAPPLTLPRPAQLRLENGLRVVVLRTSRLPVVQMQLLVPAGSAEEPDSLPGLAALTAQIVRRGTTSRSHEQFDAEAAQLGATFASSSNRDYALLGCAVGASRMEQGLELMSDAALGAVFADNEFESARKEVVALLRQQSQDVGAIADDRVWAAAAGSHPYAHQNRGDIDALIATKAEMVRTFHREHWRPDRAVLAIAGDVTPERAFAAAKEWFGRWAGRAVASRAPGAPQPHPGVRLIDLAGAPYSELRFVALAPGRGEPAWPAWQVLAQGLDHGALPDGFHATLSSQRLAGLLIVSGAAPNDSVAAWSARVRRALARAAAIAGDAPVFAKWRDDAAAAFPLQLETLGALLSQWQAADQAGMSADALEQTAAQLRGVTPEMFAAAAQSLTRALTIVAAGPGAKLRGSLAALGKVEDLAITQVREQRAAYAVPTAEQRRLGRAAASAAVLAHGGALKLAAAHALVNEGDMTLFAAGQNLQGSFSLVRVDPNRLSFATKLLQFENRQTLVGDKGWSFSRSDTASLVDVDSVAVATMQATLRGDLVHLLRSSQSASDIALRGRETIGSRVCDQVDFTTAEGVRARFAIDRVSHRVLAVDTVPDEDGVWHDRRMFSDFRQVGGLWLPFSEERSVSGERVSLFATRMAAVNGPVPGSLFVRPEVLHGQVLPAK